VKLGDIQAGDPFTRSRAELEAAFKSLPLDEQALLERTAARIKAFAEAQRAALTEVEVDIPGGRAGHTVAPVDAAGCYAPGGRYPLPSSVLMTAVTARAAGVKCVWVASPRPSAVTLGAAYVAGADGFVCVGGAQAIAALAYGIGHADGSAGGGAADGSCVPRCDVIVGPGNRWVTAAKSLVAGVCAIDMLAGPSEVLVIADASADCATVAADLLAQVKARALALCAPHAGCLV
jgi:phosphoribosyl-ATP pyrophosphohydrolase/phosphoribosyl-AMP cyclohydrolase/histidinol dehydrogenase